MPDLENTVNGLNELSKWLRNKSYSDLSARDYNETVKDAIQMLKTMEPVEPVKHELPYGTYDAVKLEYSCGACGSGLRSLPKWRDKFCSVCGRMVKWLV